MKRFFFMLLIFPLFSNVDSAIPKTLLFQSNAISATYQLENAKLPPAPLCPNPEKVLEKSSIWFSIDLEGLDSCSFESLGFSPLWEMLKEIGVEGVYLKHLKEGGSYRTGFGLSSKWGKGWDFFKSAIDKKGILLICDSIGSATGLITDFSLALQNVEEYPSLYHLVEIEQKDWDLLPKVPRGSLFVNIPWLQVQSLHKKGYIEENFSPYVKESDWNATDKMKCIDGKIRRWVYLKKGNQNPSLNFQSSSFGALRVASSDILESISNLTASGIWFKSGLDDETSQTLSLWTRKLGGFSIRSLKGGLLEMALSSSDFLKDHFTPESLLHAAVTENVEALKITYKLLLKEGISAKRLVHCLEPFYAFQCDWEHLLSPKTKKPSYNEEALTQKALENRLIREDIAKLKSPNPVTWPSICMMSQNENSFEEKYEKAIQMHLLFAFFYAMQPGVFSFSVSDLLGALSQDKVDLIYPNDKTLYGSLPAQMRNQCSFARRLRDILRVRKDSGIANGSLIEVLPTSKKGLLALLFDVSPGKKQLLAINLSKRKIEETFEIVSIKNTSAIDLMTKTLEKKPLLSPSYTLTLEPFKAKAILFQPKYYD